MVEIKAEIVKTLRDRTGIGMMECKEALQECGGDLDKAIEILRKKGHARAQDKAGREAADGAVGACLLDDNRVGVLIEVNCETDFVSRNDEFKELVKNLARQVAETNPKYISENDVPEELKSHQVSLLEQPCIHDNKIKVNDLVSSYISKFGENIKIRRFQRFALKTDQGLIGAYVHATDRLGALVEVTCQTDSVARNQEFKELVKNLAMQVAAANPQYISPEDIPAEVIDREKEIIRAQIQDTKKPAAIIEKIVEGKLNKFFGEVCLLDQPYIRDDKIKVRDLTSSHISRFGENIKVNRFARFEIGKY
jgi:elongation factor Ts